MDLKCAGQYCGKMKIRCHKGGFSALTKIFAEFTSNMYR